MNSPTSLSFFRLLTIVLFATSWPSMAARAQGVSDTTVSDTQVGYIDGAVPMNQLRLRFDSGFNFRRPTRAEYFYAVATPGTPGLPQPESNVDYHDLHMYGELLLTDRFSVFASVPAHFINPELNANSGGMGDMNAGFRWAFHKSCWGVATFQMRAYAPTGDAGRGLGNNHASLEPGILFHKPLTSRLALAGEAHYWIPIGGTDFAGDIVRYGVGVHYDLYKDCNLRITPVAEFVGWTVLDGQQVVLTPAGTTRVEDAAGDTIVNAKVGVRIGIGPKLDFYGGYGRSLTGDRWYENIARFEMRWKY